MKNILGFGISGQPVSPETAAAPDCGSAPVRSLVSVRFEDGRILTYYNDRFVLEPGDRVFVSGKLAGKPGVVENVTTKFRINLADYQKVISKAGCEVHGTYESVLDKMVSFGSDAVSPDDFRTLVMPPKHWEGQEEQEDEEIIVGEGFELAVHDIESSEDFSSVIRDRAAEYCCSGKVAYIGIRDGIGTAFIKGSSWYEVNFRLSGDMITELYCDCPYPGLCKHILAVALTIKVLADFGGIDISRDFTALDADRFWDMAAVSAKKVIL